MTTTSGSLYHPHLTCFLPETSWALSSLFNYSLSDSPLPNMCQSLELQPRIADTTLHRAHNPPLLHFSLPAPSYLPCTPFSPAWLYNHDSITHLLLISPTLYASLLPGRNQPWAMQLPAFSAPAHRLVGAARGLGPAVGLEQQSNSQPQLGSYFPQGEILMCALVICLPSQRR